MNNQEPQTVRATTWYGKRRYCKNGGCPNETLPGERCCRECQGDMYGCRFCGSLELAPGITRKMIKPYRHCTHPICIALQRASLNAGRGTLMLWHVEESDSTDVRKALEDAAQAFEEAAREVIRAINSDEFNPIEFSSKGHQ